MLISTISIVLINNLRKQLYLVPLEHHLINVLQYCAIFVVTAVQFILFNFAKYSPSIAMELKVSKEITGK